MIHEQPHIVGIGGTLRSASTSRWALERSLHTAQASGATTDLIDINTLRLPMYEPGQALESYGPEVADYLNRVRRADALIWSAAGYHGTIAGVSKNALDFLEFLARDERPYLHGRVIGLIATAGGELASVNTINAMVHVAHALRATVAPLFIAIPQAYRVFDQEGAITEARWEERLDQLGRLVAETAAQLSVAAK